MISHQSTHQTRFPSIPRTHSFFFYLTVKLSKKCEYALRALATMAGQPGQLLTIPKISAEAGVPPKFLEQILLVLRNAGLVQSRRGAGGGYILHRDPGTVRLWEIIQAVEQEESNPDPGPAPLHPMERFLQDFEKEIAERFQSKTLQDVLREFGQPQSGYFDI